jgi:hypothetical protein
MTRVLFVVCVAIFAIISAVAANSLTRKPMRPSEPRGVPITKVVIEPDAPLSIAVITKATARVFNVEVVNVSSKTIQAFDYTYYKQCATATMPGGVAVGFMPEKVLRPGAKTVFDAGEDDLVRETDIQNCLDTAKEIRVQLKTVTFTDGSTWKAAPGDFNGIRSSSP